MNPIRRLKPAYALYNLFHPRALKHNLRAYRSLGLKKTYFAPVSSKDFRSCGLEPLRADSVHLASCAAYQNLTPESQESVLNFEKNGYAILRSFIDPRMADAINSEIDALLKSGKIHFRYGNKIMFAIHQSELLRSLGKKPELIDLLSHLMGRQATLFQSINFIQGSQQRTHSDSIHMTTYPLGGLIACWLALEDVEAEQGALHYYPGSHKLPYYLNSDYDNDGSFFLTGSKTYSAYEDMIEEKIRENGLKKEVFAARKGDLLIWHANLFHGGEPHTNREKTRKSVVFHYFAEGVACYHEITQRPALLRSF